MKRELQKRMRVRPRGISPAWIKAPWLLLRSPGVFVSIVVASFILGLASGAGPVFVSSAGNASLDHELGRLSPELAGLSISAFTFVRRNAFEQADAAVMDTAGIIEELGKPTVTLIGSSDDVRRPEGQIQSEVRLLNRTGALANIRRLTPASGPGVWLADDSAKALGARPGDEIEFVRPGQTDRPFPIAGIYKALTTYPLTEYWRPLTYAILPTGENQPVPDPFVVTDRATFFAAGVGAFSNATVEWNFPLVAHRFTLSEADSLSTRLNLIAGRTLDPQTALGGPLLELQAYGNPDAETALTGAVERAQASVAALRGPVDLLSLAGRAVALAAIAAAGLFAFQRRREEVRLLSVQGVGAAALGVRAALESLLPVLIGALIAWVVLVGVTPEIGPSQLIDAGVGAGALRNIGWSSLVALLALGVTFGMATRRETAPFRAGRTLLGRAPWEAALLVLAAASLYEVVTRRAAVVSTGDSAPQIDVFVLAFPLLFLAGMTGVATRGLGRLLAHLRKVRPTAAPALYLASRRLAGASRTATLLVGASTIALGTLFYAGIVVASTDATTTAKAKVIAGADVAAIPGLSRVIPESVPKGTTGVRTDQVDILPGETIASVLQIEPATFADGAFWDTRFASVPLQELLDELGDHAPGERVPAVVVGINTPRNITIDGGGYEVPVSVVDRAAAWPGMSPSEPLIVVDQEAIDRAAEESGASIPPSLTSATEYWGRGSEERVVSALENAGIPIRQTITAAEAGDIPEIRSLSWTFGFLQALGFVTALVALVGMVLYLYSRQQSREVSYALARRMGLSRGVHRASIAVELAGLLSIALLLGALLATIAAYLVIPKLDPLPLYEPAPFFTIPATLALALPPVVLLVAWIGALQVQRAADRMKVAEVMRLAG